MWTAQDGTGMPQAVHICLLHADVQHALKHLEWYQTPLPPSDSWIPPLQGRHLRGANTLWFCVSSTENYRDVCLSNLQSCVSVWAPELCVCVCAPELYLSVCAPELCLSEPPELSVWDLQSFVCLRAPELCLSENCRAMCVCLCSRAVSVWELQSSVCLKLQSCVCLPWLPTGMSVMSWNADFIVNEMSYIWAVHVLNILKTNARVYKVTLKLWVLKEVERRCEKSLPLS